MLLAIDTSTEQVGLALMDGDKLAAESIWNSQVHHTVELAPAVEDVLRRASASITDVQAIAVALGPGSFTALRVGLAFAKGVALARQIALVGIPTLDVLAAAQPQSELPLAAVLRAGRGRVAVQWYTTAIRRRKRAASSADRRPGQWMADGPPAIMTVNTLAQSIARPSLVAGELTTEERELVSQTRINVALAPLHRCVRRPSVLAEIGWERCAAGHYDDAATLAPIYLHVAEPAAA